VQIYKQALRFQEIASGVFVQRIPARYLKRLYNAQGNDPVVQALRNLDNIFAECKRKDVDMVSSLEAVLDEFEHDRASAGAVLLAWSMSFDAERKVMNEPRLVGITTLSCFAFTSNFSTDSESLSSGDQAKLRPYVGRWMYMDGMCSTQPGVGRLLVMHAFQYAIAHKKQGLIALSYSMRRSAVPESKRIFAALNFDTVIPQANFKIQMYGTWFAKSTADVGLAGMAEAAVGVCTRTGFTPKTADTLMWRCPL
jgi:hypothetical protein